MYRYLSHLILYSDRSESSILYETGELFRNYDNGIKEKAELVKDAYNIVRKILDISTAYAFDENLWTSYLTYYIINAENSFSASCERRGAIEGSVNSFAKHDFEIFMKLFRFDFSEIERELGTDCFSILCDYKAVEKPSLMYNPYVMKSVRELRVQLENAEDPDEFFTVVSDFYREYGAGIFGVNRAFRISDREDILEFEPVKSMDDVVLEDLVGYEVQKQRLLENTKAFVDGKPANNVLLYGDRGTGKSTSIKAVANRFWPDGLRVIQVYRHQMKMLSRIISAIRTRNYRFIIYMDDLSFEDFETEYKYLKAVIEGGLESKAENILIYATSNRRHLIKETWDDRNDMEHTGELHRGDSMEEKLSLADRFGVQIYYGKPSKDEFYRIIDELSKTEGVTVDREQLHKEANAWQIRHGDVSGRCARQFVDYIKGKV